MTRRVAALFVRSLALTVLVLATLPATAAAQLGQLASPGPLTRAHAKLEGADKCIQCHEPGRKVTAAKCLTCHRPIAERIAQKRGVHREVTDQCVVCHAEHNGVDAELRPFDQRKFDHQAVTGFGLDGRHAGLTCARCHKTRSFLGLSPACATCHTDVHKGSLGPNCVSCHPTTAPFKDAVKQFDHGKTLFALTGAHQRVECAKCHVNNQFKGIKFDTCATCHKDPHARKLGACTTCHTTETWRTQKIDHSRTAYPLAGKHETVACAKCHVQAPVKVHLKFAKCADCHSDPHKGKFKDACETCHKVTGFGGSSGTFDHLARTGYALTGKHVAVECVKCHKGAAKVTGPIKGKTVDFSGAKKDCQSCHADPHKGSLGATCTTCHSTDTFAVKTFKHPKNPELYEGQHATVACAKCHLRAPTQPLRSGATPTELMTFKGTPNACAACHADVHLGQLGAKCETCHTVTGAKFAVAGFDHAKTTYPLTGKHQQVTCEECHKTETGTFPAGPGTARRFKGLGTTCLSCHKDEHLGQVGKQCETCHTTASFKVGKYKHKNPEGFFVGAHQSLECVKCHKREEGNFPAGRGTAVRFQIAKDCTSCHKDAHNGQLGADCKACHTPSVWRDPNRAFHRGNSFPLTGKHLAVDCASCHVKGVLKGTPTHCYDCHWVRRQDDFYRLRLGSQCDDCHKTTAWTAVTWDHGARTGMALNIAHKLLACDSCHKDRVFEGKRPECISCHEPQFRSAKNPDHVAAAFPVTCDLCHSPGAPTWSGAKFVHSTYQLRGAHATASCESCHKNGVYAGTPRDCYSCHQADYAKTTNPNHKTAGFPTSCETCHREGGPEWKSSGGAFNHAAFFPLEGAHATTDCASCHKNGQFAGTPKDCFSCHQADYRGAKNPDHVAANFSTACEQCHRRGGPGWTRQGFTHTSAFPLTGIHAVTACVQCHQNGQYQGKSKECASCHTPDYQRAANPNHVTAGFPMTCEQCHKSGGPGWTGAAGFDHNQFFVLQGSHATAACVQCHKNGQYAGTPKDCFSCHQPNYQATSNPNHAAAGFPTTCEQCHKSGGPGWTSASFNHNQFFALTGNHASAACAQCHKNGQYAGTPKDCVSCHQADYQSAANPNHAAAGFPTACEQCHKSGGPGWKGATFNHAQFWVLAGMHATAACSACHKNGQYAGTPKDCYSCHQANFTNAKNPSHAGFSTACETCHKSGGPGWTGANFNHAQFWALSGLHATTACANCHKNGQTAGTPKDCFSCHKTNYDATTNPKHSTAGFSTSCDQCHKNGGPGWTGATFNHANFFVLSGLHATTACASCHKNGQYAGTPKDCYSCHATNYANAKNPSHAGFPTTCEQCHKSGGPGWTGATFNHAQYWTLSGMHATIACTSCHKNGVYAGTPKDCYSCHQAKYAATSQPPHGPAGFATTCDQCHKNGGPGWTGNTTWKHSTYFNLVGVHATQSCAACHKNNVYKGTPTTCVGCHLAKYNATTNPNHVAAGFPTSCESCHKATDSAWTQGVFNHTAFPITSGRHAGIACSVCHTTANNFTVFSCLTGCHAKATTDSHHQGRSGYRYDSAACYSCHPTGRGD